MAPHLILEYAVNSRGQFNADPKKHATLSDSLNKVQCDVPA